MEDVGAVYADMWDKVTNNKTAGALWPNDSDGPPGATRLPASRRPRRSAATGSSTPASTRTGQGLLRADRRLPRGECRDSARRADPARLHDVLAAGRSAALPAEDRDDRQGAAVPVERRGPRATRAEPGHRGLVVAQPSVHLVADRPDGGGLAAAYTTATGKQWTQPIGFAHALFEVAAKALSAVVAIDDRQGIANAISQMKLDTVVGPLDWTAGPVPNVARTPVVGGQWRRDPVPVRPGSRQQPAVPRHPDRRAGAAVERRRLTVPISRSGSGAAGRRRR